MERRIAVGSVRTFWFKALAALVPTCMLFMGSTLMFVRGKREWSVLQLLGAAGLVLVVLTHLGEALQLFHWMQWGQERSVGHYIDLFGAILGITLFPMGILASRTGNEAASAKSPVFLAGQVANQISTVST